MAQQRVSASSQTSSDLFDLIPPPPGTPRSKVWEPLRHPSDAECGSGGGGGGGAGCLIGSSAAAAPGFHMDIHACLAGDRPRHTPRFLMNTARLRICQKLVRVRCMPSHKGSRPCLGVDAEGADRVRAEAAGPQKHGRERVGRGREGAGSTMTAAAGTHPDNCDARLLHSGLET